MKWPVLQNRRVAIFRMAFRPRKVFGTFEKRAPGLTTDTRIVITNHNNKQRSLTECVHMTSRRPCWRSKQRNGGHVGGVKYSFGDWTLFLCKFLLLFHYANMASGHMSEHTLYLKQSLNAYHLSKLVSSQQRISAATLRSVSGQNDSAVEGYSIWPCAAPLVSQNWP